MSRMSLDSAKMVLRNRGYNPTGDSHKGYRVLKDGIDCTTLITGRGVVKFAKQVLKEEEERRSVLNKDHNMDISVDPEILAEMQATWEPGTTVVNVLTGRRMVI